MAPICVTMGKILRRGNERPSFAAPLRRRGQRRHKVAFTRESVAFLSRPIRAETETKETNCLRKAIGCTNKALFCLVHGIHPETLPNGGHSLHKQGNFMPKSRAPSCHPVRPIRAIDRQTRPPTARVCAIQIRRNTGRRTDAAAGDATNASFALRIDIYIFRNETTERVFEWICRNRRKRMCAT